MRCQALTANRHYGQPGPCESRAAIKFVRWAATPLVTRARWLCIRHRGVQERGGKLGFVKSGAVVK